MLQPPIRVIGALLMLTLLTLLAGGLYLWPFSDTSTSGHEAQGYIEGDYLFLSTDRPGRLETLPLTEGTHIREGTLVFRLNTSVEEAALSAAQARSRQAESTLEDLMKGARPERMASLQADVKRFRARLDFAIEQYERDQALFREGGVSEGQYELSLRRMKEAEANLESAEALQALAGLPEREDRIQAARHGLEAANQEAERLRREIAQHEGHAPADGLVQEIVRRPGETLPAGGVVASFLPDSARRAIFFVPQSALAGLLHGTQVNILCDGCPQGLSAPVTFIADEVEFTPPVIFGPHMRERLVVRVEAVVSASDAPSLKPGQPITVTWPVRGANDGQ